MESGMKWAKITPHALWETAYEGRCSGQEATFWLWKEAQQWRVTCSALGVVGVILARGAEDDAAAQRLAVRFFEGIALGKAQAFLSLTQALGASC